MRQYLNQASQFYLQSVLCKTPSLPESGCVYCPCTSGSGEVMAVRLPSILLSVKVEFKFLSLIHISEPTRPY